MSERPRRSRRRRRRPAVIEEGGQQSGQAQADSGSGDDDGGRTERRRGARVHDGPEKRNTILGMPRFIFFMMAGLFTIVVVMTVAQQFVDTSTNIEGVEAFPDQGRRHLAAGEAFDLDDYNSFPPTSGPQAVEGATPGIYGPDAEDEAFRQAPPFAELLPILEQGGIVVYYDPGRLSESDSVQLQSFVGQIRGDIVVEDSPNERDLDLVALVELDESLPAAIVATSWRHILSLDVLDEDGLTLLAEFVSPDPLGLYARFVLDPA